MNLTFMRRAVELAHRGEGRVSPNPLVGAVLVRKGRIIGEGWHDHYGDLHAERAALKDCAQRGESARGAELYVTLEPCCHHGKQPPCTDALIEAGISHVYVGSGDPNPKVAGQGIALLRAGGIQVTEQVLKAECRALNDIFFHYITSGLPLVYLKYAMTLDGKIACYTGASRWVSGEAARAEVHRLRNRCAAIMVGVNTVEQDDPLLTCRMEGGRNPLRIICDSTLRTPLDSRIIQSASEIPTLLATCCEDSDRAQRYEALGCRILLCSARDGRVDLPALMRALGAMQIDSVLLEGGAELAWSALRDGVVQRVQAYIAPKLFGGSSAKTPVGGTGFAAPDQAIQLKHTQLKQLGEDYLIEGEVIR